MTDAIVERLDELIAVMRGADRDRWMRVAEVARLLDFDVDYTRQEIVVRPDFPRPMRIDGRGHPRWLESEVRRWARTQQA